MRTKHSLLVTLGLAALPFFGTGCAPAAPRSSAPTNPLVLPPLTQPGTPRERLEVTPRERVSEPEPVETPMSSGPFGPSQPPRKEEEEPAKELPPEPAPPLPESAKPLNKNKTLFFEVGKDGKRRVYVLAEVCLRQGPLEVFLCKNMTKEHESILHADVDAREIHAALEAAGAKAGTPVQFVNPRTMKEEYKPATGTPVKVLVRYRKGGEVVTEPAQRWITDIRNKKDMAHDWVFAGSRFFKNPDRPDDPPYYTANNGEIISIANFVDSMLDLPVKSPRENADLAFEANTARIPPLNSKVYVILEPVVDPKKK